jgi:hypothetical protein
VTRTFTAALASSQQLPRPVPPHSSSSSSKPQQQQQQQGNTAAAAAAPADTQFALLQLHALGAHGLGLGLLNCHPSADAGGFDGSDGYNSVSNGQGSSVAELVAQLLRVAGHSANPLDCSTAWQLLGILQAVGALPSRRQECEWYFLRSCGFMTLWCWVLSDNAQCQPTGLLHCLAAAGCAAGSGSAAKPATGM